MAGHKAVCWAQNREQTNKITEDEVGRNPKHCCRNCIFLAKRYPALVRGSGEKVGFQKQRGTNRSGSRGVVPSGPLRSATREFGATIAARLATMFSTRIGAASDDSSRGKATRVCCFPLRRTFTNEGARNAANGLL